MCPAELRRVADRLRERAGEATESRDRRELIFLVKEYEAQALHVEQSDLGCDPTFTLLLPK